MEARLPTDRSDEQLAGSPGWSKASGSATGVSLRKEIALVTGPLVGRTNGQFLRLATRCPRVTGRAVIYSSARGPNLELPQNRRDSRAKEVCRACTRSWRLGPSPGVSPWWRRYPGACFDDRPSMRPASPIRCGGVPRSRTHGPITTRLTPAVVTFAPPVNVA